MFWLTTTLLTFAWQTETPAVQEPAPAEVPAPKKKTQQGGKKKEADRSQRGDKQKDPRKMTREEAQRWWESLSEEERQQARERMKRFQEMSPEARRELERRAELLRTVGEEVIAGMSEEQCKEFDALPREERARVHRELVRAKLKEQGENIDGWEDFPQRGKFEDRLQQSREKREEWAKKRHQRELDRAVEDGWLSSKAAEKLRAGSPEKLEETLDQVRQWRMIEHFDEKGLWEKLEIDEAEQKRLKALPPREFLDEMRKRSAPLRERGRRGNRGGEGPPRGEGPQRGRGEGPPPHPPRGEGPPPERPGDGGKGGRPGGGRRGGGRF